MRSNCLPMYRSGSGIHTGAAHWIHPNPVCFYIYIGCTIRSFRARVGDEHMRAQYRLKNPRLHYAAMDEPHSENQWYLLGQAKEYTDQAIIRITEEVAIACIHTYTSIAFSDILKRYGIVENTSTARGLNRTSGVKDWGARTLDSALQMVLHQRLIEEHGGDGDIQDTAPSLKRLVICSGKQRGTSKASKGRRGNWNELIQTTC